jgi:hypothetical protein
MRDCVVLNCSIIDMQPIAYYIEHAADRSSLAFAMCGHNTTIYTTNPPILTALRAWWLSMSRRRRVVEDDAADERAARPYKERP